jgi:hypothetical protein
MYRESFTKEEITMEHNENEIWAIIELMGHGQTAGIIRTSDLGGLLRVDVPIGEGFRTEYYGEQAIYAIRVVSEEIARAYALPEREICAYNEPIVSRAQYEEALQKARNHSNGLQHHIDVLQRRLTQVNALPEPKDNDEEFA